jgi:hypothetical protein
VLRWLRSSSGLFEMLPGLITDKQVPLASSQMCAQPATLDSRAAIYVRQGCHARHRR